MRRALLCTLLLFTLALADVESAWARLKVSPSLTLREEYNDNIFLEKDREEDFITTVAPSLSVFLDTRSIKSELTYGFRFRLHSNESELDETEPSEAQRAFLNVDIFPDRDFTVNVLDEFRRVALDERRPFIEENLVVNRTNFNRFRVNPRYQYRRWKTFTATLSYEYEDLAYDAEEGNDSERHRGGLELEKRFSEKLSVSSGFARTSHQSDDADDYRRDDIHVGFIHRPGPKLTLNARGGVAILDRTGEDEEQERLLSALAEYAMTEEIRLGLSYDETVYDSVSFGLIRGRAGRAFLSYRLRLPTEVALTVKEDDYLETDREDFSIGASVQTGVTFRNRVSIQAKPYVTWFRFRPEDDHVLRYGVGFSIQREFRYGHLRLGYDHHASENGSTVNDEYRNNIVYLEAAVGF